MSDEKIQEASEQLLPQRWMCLIAMVAAVFFMQFSLIIMPGIASTIIPELGLSPASFGMLANMPYLCGVLFGVVMGNVGDRVGIKKLMTIAIAVFIVGAFWRWASGTYAMLMLSSLVMGFGLAVLNANSTKGIRLWFPGKSLGPAMGLYIAGASLGAGVALTCGGMWGTKLSLLISGFSAVLTLVLWVALYRTHPMESSDTADAVQKGAFAAVMKNKDVWVVSLMMFFVFGNSTTFQTYMIEALNQFSNFEMVALVAALAGISTIFVSAASVVMPAVIGKFSNLRMAMVVNCIINAVCVILLVVIPFGVISIALLGVIGITLGAMLAMGKTVPALVPGIDPRNLGAVGGLQSTLQNLGGWVVAGYIIAPIAQSIYGPISMGETGPVFGSATYGAIYVGAAICSILVAVCYLLLHKGVKMLGK